MELYFNDRLLSRGKSDIMNANGDKVGFVDLEGMLTSSLSVYGPDKELRCSGKIRTWGYKWIVTDPSDETLGLLSDHYALFGKKYKYDATDRGSYTIEAPAFSRSYTIFDESGSTVATFEKTSKWLQPGAFCLLNTSPQLDDYELITVVLGIHHYQKRRKRNE